MNSGGVFYEHSSLISFLVFGLFYAFEGDLGEGVWEYFGFVRVIKHNKSEVNGRPFTSVKKIR